MTPQSDRAARRYALISLLVVWLAFDFPVLAGRALFPVDLARSRSPYAGVETLEEPHNPLESDAVDLYHPWRTYLGRRLEEGDLPLWDPHRFGGTPFAANPQAAVWYPANWAFAVLPFLGVFTGIAVLSRLGALLLAYWFFRVLRLHPYAAALGAICFAFSGFLIAWAVHPTFMASAMWLPLALGGLQVAFDGRPRRGIPLAALGLALTVLGGHIQVALYVWVAAVLWSVVGVGSRAMGASGRRAAAESVVRGSLSVASAFLLGAGLASLQLLGTAELSGRIVRGAESYSEVAGAAIPLQHAATFLVPDRLGNPVDGNYVGAINYTETAAYVGILTLMLALIAMWRCRDRLVLGFGAIGAVGLLSAFGTPVYRLLYSTVPGMAQTRSVGRLILLIDVALAGLAAVGLDWLLRHRGGVAGTAVVAGAVVSGALVLAAILPGPAPPAGYLAPRLALAAAILVVGTAAASLARPQGIRSAVALGLVALVGADLWLFGFRYHLFQRPADLAPPVPEVEALATTPGVRPRFIQDRGYLSPNTALIEGLYGLGGSDTFILSRSIELAAIEDRGVVGRVRETNTIRALPGLIGTPVASLLGVSRILAPAAGPDFGSPVFAGRFGVFDSPAAFPPAFLASCWQLVPPGSADRIMSGMDAETLRSRALVDAAAEAHAALPQPSPLECEPGPPAKIDRYEPERIVVTVEARASSVLVVTDAWDPGWEATVDGEPAPVLVVDHAVRGVALGPGAHTVVMVYRPGWLRLGVIITIVAGAIVLILAFGPVLRRARVRSGRAPPRP